MTIIKIAPEWNNAHCSLDNVGYCLWGWAELPTEFARIWAENVPFVSVTTNEKGEIIQMAACEELLPEEETTEIDSTEEVDVVV